MKVTGTVSLLCQSYNLPQQDNSFAFAGGAAELHDLPYRNRNPTAYKDTLSMKFDGKDYEEKGPNVAPGSMSSGKRVNAHTLEVTDKVKGEVMDHTKFEVST